MYSQAQIDKRKWQEEDEELESEDDLTQSDDEWSDGAIAELEERIAALESQLEDLTHKFLTKCNSNSKEDSLSKSLEATQVITSP